MPTLADLTPAELRARRRMLKARMKRRTRALTRAGADLSEVCMLLKVVEMEVARRERVAKGNSRKR